MVIFDKKDSYIPALRVSSEFAERAQDACDKLFLHPPKVRREAWEDLIRIAESGQNLVRPIRMVTQELLAELSDANIDDIKLLFPAPAPVPRRKFGAYAATAAAAAAITVMSMSPFLLKHHRTESSIAKAIPSPTVALVESEPMPVPFPAAPPPLPTVLPTPEPTLTALARSETTPVPTPLPLASPTPMSPSPKEAPATKLPEEEILSPQPPTRLAVKHGKRTKHGEVTITPDTKDVMVAKNSHTKNTAVAKASTAWDKKEHSIDHQLNTVDRKIAKTGDNQEQENLKEQKKYLQRRKDYVRRSRTYHQNNTRLVWDKEHGTSMLVDSIRASLGF